MINKKLKKKTVNFDIDNEAELKAKLKTTELYNESKSRPYAELEGKSLYEISQIYQNQVRKQICDEIKARIAKEYGKSVEDMPKLYHCLAWSVKDIYELLDQIEKENKYV